MVALTMQDHLGEFLKDVYDSGYAYEELDEYDSKEILTAEEIARAKEEYNTPKKARAKKVAEKISAEAAKNGIGVEEYFDLITCYYRADAGSYTVDAGGIESLDFLFEKETAPNCTRVFSEQTQKNYEILVEAVKSIASNKE
jgi:hypothetical protein